MYNVDKHTVALLHFENGVRDETGKLWITGGIPQISTEKKKYGRNSLYLDGTAYLTATDHCGFDLKSENFTIDWWEYRTSLEPLKTVAKLGDSPDKSCLLIGHISSGYKFVMLLLMDLHGMC